MLLRSGRERLHQAVPQPTRWRHRLEAGGQDVACTQEGAQLGVRLGARIEMLDHVTQLIGLERSQRQCRAELVDCRVVERSHRLAHRSTSRTGSGSVVRSGAAVLEAIETAGDIALV